MVVRHCYGRRRRSLGLRLYRLDNLRGLLGISRMDKVPKVWIKELFGVTKGVAEGIDEGILWWFGHVERMDDD